MKKNTETMKDERDRKRICRLSFWENKNTQTASHNEELVQPMF